MSSCQRFFPMQGLSGVRTRSRKPPHCSGCGRLKPRPPLLLYPRRIRRCGCLSPARCLVLTADSASGTANALHSVSIGMCLAFALPGSTRADRGAAQPPTSNADYRTTHSDARHRGRRDDACVLSGHRVSPFCRFARCGTPRITAAAFLVRDCIRVARSARRDTRDV